MPTISRVKVGDVVYDLKDNDFSLENLSEHIPELIDGKVTESSIVAGSITSDKIASGAITTEKLAAESVTADQIAASAVTTEKLDAEAVTADQIAAGAITTEKLDAEAVTADKIETHTITADQIASHTITAEEIASHTITSDEISSHTIKSDNIMAGAITADEIAALSITTDKLAALAITTDKIAANAIEADNLAAGSVVAGKIAANAIEADNIQANAITTDKLDSQAVTAEKIESHSITADQIEAGTITATEIAAGAITSEEIAANTITADNIASSTITSDEIASHTIKSDNIMAGAITADEIASLAVTTDKLDALSITSDKIAAYAVEANNLAAGSVVAGKIAADAIEADNIQANAITTDKLASQAVTADKIKSHSITADQIEAETITADEIAADAITTEKIQAGAVNAGNIAANAITTDKIQAGAVKTNSIDSGAITTSKIAAGAITADSAIIADGAIGNAQISSAGIDYAKVKDLNASSAYFGDAIFEEAIGGKLYVPRLLFNTAQGRQMLVEDIIIGASNGNYYSLDITETDGVVSMTPTQVQVTSSEISNGHSTDGKAIIGTTATYDDLATTNLYAIDALIDTITAKRIDVDELWSREAFINKLMVQDISSNTYIQSTIGSWSATHTNTLTDEISGINRTIGELGRGQIFYSLTEPEDPSVGDLWIKPQLMTTWGSIGAFTWEELEEYKWIELGIPPKQFVYGNSGWESVNDSSMYTVLQTQLSQTDERINLKATQADLNLMNQRVSETEAQIDIHSGQITQEIVDRKNGDATAEQNAKDASIAKTAQYQTAQDIVSSVESWVGGELEDYSTSSQTSQEIALAVSGKNAIYRQASAPAGTTKNPLVAGDLWFDTSNGNTPKRYNGSTWVETGDTTKYTVQSGIDIKAAGIEISGGTYVKIKSGGSFSIDSSKFEIDASGNVKMEGEVRASSGSIGGWTINATSLTNSKVGLIKTSADSAIAIYAGNATPASAAFHVTQGGALTATDATIVGSVTATSGKIGGWTVSSTAITNGIVGLNTTLVNNGISIYAGNETPASAPFRVTRGGALTATNATITGKVTATSGSVGGWTIGSDWIGNGSSFLGSTVGMRSTSGDNVAIWAGHTSGQQMLPTTSKFSVTANGYLKSTSGDIGGWSISSNKLTSGNSSNYVALSTSGDYVMWAGSSDASNAPFRVKRDGTIYSTKLISLNEDGIENTIDIRDYSLWKLNYATVKSMSVSGNTLSITTTAGSITFRKAAYDQIEELTLSGTPSASSKRMLAHVVVSDSTSGQTFTMPDKVVDVSDAYNAGYNAALSDCGVPADRTSYTVYTGSESQVMIQGVGLKWVVSPYAGHAVSRK